MAHNRPPFNDASPKMETVFTKTSIQREYMLKQSSTDALNASLSSTGNEGVTSDSFFAHGFRNQRGLNLAKKNDQLDSLQSEASILNFERDIHEVTQALRNLPDLNDSSETATRREPTDYQFSANESDLHPASKTTLFKSLYEHAQDAHGEYTTQEVSAKQGFDERGIEDVFNEKQVLAQSTKKPTTAARQTSDVEKALQQEPPFTEKSEKTPESVFARYKNRSDARARYCKPHMWLILLLLALLVALFVMILILYYFNDHTLRECVRNLDKPIQDFCVLKPYPLRLNFNKNERLENSESFSRFLELQRDFCRKDNHSLAFARNKTAIYFFSNDERAKTELVPKIISLPILSSIFLGEEFYFNVTDSAAEAVLHLLGQIMTEKTYVEAIERAFQVIDLMKDENDKRTRFTKFSFPRSYDHIIEPEKDNNTVGIIYEGSPQELYLSLVLTTLCPSPGSRRIDYNKYVASMKELMRHMEC